MELQLGLFEVLIALVCAAIATAVYYGERSPRLRLLELIWKNRHQARSPRPSLSARCARFSPQCRRNRQATEPPTYPFVGNVPQLHGCIHELCRQWSRQYKSPIISLKLLHGDVLVFNSAKVVKELVDKRSSVFSSRPPSYVVQTLIAQGDHPLFLPYGKEWSKLRRIMHSHFSAEKCRNEHGCATDVLPRRAAAEASQTFRTPRRPKCFGKCFTRPTNGCVAS